MSTPPSAPGGPTPSAQAPSAPASSAPASSAPPPSGPPPSGPPPGGPPSEPTIRDASAAGAAIPFGSIGPIVGGMIVGVGVLALVYKMSTANNRSTPPVRAAPKKKSLRFKVEEEYIKDLADYIEPDEVKPKSDNEGKTECVWPCPRSRKETGPCRPRNFACDCDD